MNALALGNEPRRTGALQATVEGSLVSRRAMSEFSCSSKLVRLGSFESQAARSGCCRACS
jgi:hypothetical protein